MAHESASPKARNRGDVMLAQRRQARLGIGVLTDNVQDEISRWAAYLHTCTSHMYQCLQNRAMTKGEE